MEKLVLEAFLPYRLNRLSAAVSQQLKAVYGKKYGLTVPEWRLLATLGQFGSLTAKQVGEHSAMHKTKVSRAVATLEKRRWLKRNRSDSDRREELLSLTRLGTGAYNSIYPEMARFERDIYARLRVRDLSALSRSLQALERVVLSKNIPSR